MTQQTNYLVFLQNTQTGEEFTAPTEAPAGAYEIAMGKLRQQYSAPKFKVHTAYMVSELEAILNSSSRWPGLASSVQMGTQKIRKAAPVRVTLGEAARQATSASITHTQEAPVPATKPQAQPVQQAAQPMQTTPAPAAAATTSQTSVIEQLKAMRS